MPKVSIQGNQLTLPDELRQALTTAEDDSLDAEEVVEGILLRRSPSARRKAGLANFREAQSGVGYIGPLSWPSAEEEEQNQDAKGIDARHQRIAIAPLLFKSGGQGKEQRCGAKRVHDREESADRQYNRFNENIDWPPPIPNPAKQGSVPRDYRKRRQPSMWASCLGMLALRGKRTRGQSPLNPLAGKKRCP